MFVCHVFENNRVAGHLAFITQRSCDPASMHMIRGHSAQSLYGCPASRHSTIARVPGRGFFCTEKNASLSGAASLNAQISNPDCRDGPTWQDCDQFVGVYRHTLAGGRFNGVQASHRGRSPRFRPDSGGVTQ